MSGSTKCGYMVAGALLVVVVQVVPLALAVVAGESAPEDTLRTRAREIVSVDGMVVARVSSDDSGRTVELFDPDGAPRTADETDRRFFAPRGLGESEPVDDGRYHDFPSPYGGYSGAIPRPESAVPRPEGGGPRRGTRRRPSGCWVAERP